MHKLAYADRIGLLVAANAAGESPAAAALNFTNAPNAVQDVMRGGGVTGKVRSDALNPEVRAHFAEDRFVLGEVEVRKDIGASLSSTKLNPQ